jgi:hypothetical protein
MPIVSSTFHFLKDYLVRIFIFCFLLTYMRIPIAASLGVYSLRRILIILPVIVSIFVIAVSVLQTRKFKTSWLTKIYLINLVICSLYCAYMVRFVGLSFNYDLLPTMGPIVLCFFPILAIEQFDLNIEELSPIFEKISLVVIWGGFFWFALQGFSHIDADRLSGMLLPLKYQLEAYPNSTFYSHRRIGFLLRLEPSALAIMAGSVYIYCLCFIKKFSSPALKAFYLISSFFGLFGIVLSTSLSLLIVSPILFAIVTLIFLKKYRVRIIISAVSILTASVVLVKSTFCSFMPRILLYSSHFNLFFNKMFAFRADCSITGFFMRFEPKENVVNKCEAKEMVFYTTFSNYGLLPLLAWHVFTFTALYMLFWIFRHNRKDMLPLGLFAFCCLVPAFHMSGVETWGNNYMFVLAVFCLFQWKVQSAFQPSGVLTESKN